MAEPFAASTSIQTVPGLIFSPAVNTIHDAGSNKSFLADNRGFNTEGANRAQPRTSCVLTSKGRGRR